MAATDEGKEEVRGEEGAKGPKKYYAKDFEWGAHLGEGAFGAVWKGCEIER